MECLCEGRRDRLWSVSAAAGIQRAQIPLDLADVGREAKVLGDIGVVLWRMIAVRDEADAEVLLRLELARLEYMLADGLDVLGRGRDVAALAACAVLDKDEVSVVPAAVSRRTPPAGEREGTYSILRSPAPFMPFCGACCSWYACAKTAAADS